MKEPVHEHPRTIADIDCYDNLRGPVCKNHAHIGGATSFFTVFGGMF